MLNTCSDKLVLTEGDLKALVDWGIKIRKAKNFEGYLIEHKGCYLILRERKELVEFLNEYMNRVYKKSNVDENKQSRRGYLYHNAEEAGVQLWDDENTDE